jgi:hypothetical protein
MRNWGCLLTTILLSVILFTGRWNYEKTISQNITSNWYIIVFMGIGIWFFLGQIRLFIRYSPRGGVKTYNFWQVFSANSRLALSAKCPQCGSRNLLWYRYLPQYSDRLHPGDEIYIRCQRCNHDDYTNL